VTPRLLIEPARLAGRSLLRLQSDERLVDLVRAGNDRAFEAIVDRYDVALLRYCARLLPRARAEDVVQQAFLNAFAALRRDEARIDLRPWLYRIAHNAALTALRENGWTHENVERLVRGHESAHDAVQRRADLREVLAAVGTLPERQREAILLRELEGRSYAQIAVELDVTGGAVRQLLNRARNTLRAGATALTPTALLTRPGSQRVVERVTQAAATDELRGVGRLAGALAASLALAGGLAVGPRHMLPGAHGAGGADGTGAGATPAGADGGLRAFDGPGAPRRSPFGAGFPFGEPPVLSASGSAGGSRVAILPRWKHAKTARSFSTIPGADAAASASAPATAPSGRASHGVIGGIWEARPQPVDKAPDSGAQPAPSDDPPAMAAVASVAPSQSSDSPPPADQSGPTVADAGPTADSQLTPQ
jgi:RNA polymerase sigma factor (sigma-70 family)